MSPASRHGSEYAIARSANGGPALPLPSARFSPRVQISAIEGAHKAFRRSSDAGRDVEYHFCPECGSTVFWYRDGAPELAGISVGCFADPTFPAPKAAIWAAHKLHWVEFPSGMPVLSAQPD